MKKNICTKKERMRENKQMYAARIKIHMQHKMIFYVAMVYNSMDFSLRKYFLNVIKKNDFFSLSPLNPSISKTFRKDLHTLPIGIPFVKYE